MEDTMRRQSDTCHLQQRSQSSASYAFLNHSSITLPNNLPPAIDDKPLVRQKRRRTSPEDQAILEAAYIRDSKPDKAARLELVKQVGLGEREVQIWFQNRRQTSRRKSRPLLPHEVAQYQLARSGASVSNLHFDLSSESGHDEDATRLSHAAYAARTDDVDGHAPSSDASNYHSSGHTPYLSSNQSAPSYSAESSSYRSNVSAHSASSARDASLDSKHTVSLGYLANRRSLSSLQLDRGVHQDSAQHDGSFVGGAPHQLQRSSSFVRLCLTSEGNAKVTTKDGSSPSPPRPPQALQLDLIKDKETYSPRPDVHSAPSANAINDLRRTSSGRSRDSRAWEFWCDKDSRGELEDKAEKEASGSAADAIDLLRSTSGRRILGALSFGKNSLLSRHPSSSKRIGNVARLSSLQRSSTSFGRLQTKAPPGANAISKPVPKLKSMETSISIHIPGNDSDKENWSPQSTVRSEDSLDPESKCVPSASSAQAMSSGTGNFRRQYLQNHASTLLSKVDGKTLRDENTDPEADPELASFMRGGIKSNSVSAEDDLDCVQSLLSLSQGNWR